MVLPSGAKCLQWVWGLSRKRGASESGFVRLLGVERMTDSGRNVLSEGMRT
jgi:hypothetical protein